MTARERGTIRAGAVAVLLGWALLRLLPVVLHSQHERSVRLVAKTSAYERAKTDIAALDSLEDAAEKVQARVKTIAPMLLSGTTASEAAADAAARTRAVAESHGARVDAVRGLSDSSGAGQLRRSRLQLEFTTDTRGLFAVMQAIDRYPVVLTVTSVRIVASDGPEATGSWESLRVELGITGFYLTDREAS